MLRGIGMSILLSWICLNSYAQLPHPNDTLENGKKVPFNQFLGRFSVFNEFYGTSFPFSLNVSYSVLRTNLITTDISIGAKIWPRQNSVDYVGRHQYIENDFPVGVTLFVGRRTSRLNVRTGYMLKLSPNWFTDTEKPYPHCGDYCPSPPQHFYFFSVGYTYQHPYGLFFSLNAYGIYRFPRENSTRPIPLAERFFPMGGLSIGYRLPSRQLHREWTERSFKRRVLRLEEPEEKQKKGDDIDEIFYNDSPLEIDSTEVLEIEEKLAKLKKRHERYLKEEQRPNGRSHVFVEGFGAAGFWSVNYSYTHPIGKSKIFAMDYRGGYGTDSEDMALPLAIGVKAMKNYRGTGLFIGAMPRYNWTNGKVGFVYFLQHNVEFHFAYGLTGGVSFYFLYDPTRFLFQRDWAAYGGFFLGYRLPQMKKA